MATIHELSKICGVSVSTVSKALNGYADISAKTRNLIIKAANELGYLPNSGARSPRLKKSYTIGILFRTMTNLGLKNDYFAYILEAFRREAAESGYDITFIQDSIGTRKMTYLEHCLYRHFDGVCIVCADFEKEDVIELVNSDLPVVTIDYAFQKAYSIISDNYSGMKRLTNYILRQGHTKVGFISGGNSLVTRNRIDGFLDTMREHKIKVPKEYMRSSNYRNAFMAEEQAMKLLQLPDYPTCIIAPDDMAAMGVVSAIRKCGLQLVKDVSIAGYDCIDAQQYVGVRLTTIKQEREKIGVEAARKLIQMIEHGKDIPCDTVFIKQSLVIGNSIRKIS